MSALEPGLYRATVRGVPGESIVMVGDDGNSTFSLDGEGNVRRCYVFTDARPLIVLDLDDPAEFVRALGECAPSNFADTDSDDFRIMAIANQIREQTKPARIEEPGLWGVVEAEERDGTLATWLHHPGGWARPGRQLPVRWVGLIDPVLVRDGVQS